MAGKSSPFKKFSHHRGNSTEEPLQSQIHHRKSPSIGTRNPPIAGHTRDASRSSNTSVSSNFLAEQYERDRRAILSSCFAEDTLGSNAASKPSKTYVTHVRIIEDTRYPSSRPPATSPLANKKKRVLIVSARTNGAGMQIHKARENTNGSIQIGRTWSLKELVCVESDLEHPEGFAFTMGKRYYWETNSAKERTVFIKTLIKIYMEESGGRVPRLVNWDLSLFYLDEQSYKRAAIPSATQHSVSSSGQSTSRPATTASNQSSATSGFEASPHVPHAPVKLPAIASRPNHSQDSRNTGSLAPETKQPRLHNSSTGIPQHPQHVKPPSRSKEDPQLAVAASQRAPTPTHVSERPREEPQLNVATTHRAPTPTHYSDRSSPSSKSLNDPANYHQHASKKGGYDQQKAKDAEPLTLLPSHSSHQSLQAPSGEAIPYHLHEAKDSQTPDSADFLSELNSVLTEPSKPSQLNGLIMKDVRDPELASFSITKQDDESAEIEDLNKSVSSDEVLSMDLKDDTNELSFERGDEMRYSQVLEERDEELIDENDVNNEDYDDLEEEHGYHASHAYHEVSVIKEEPVTVPAGDFKKEELSVAASAFSGIGDQVLVETLEDVSWSVEDGSTELLHKLSKKLADTEYLLNRELVALPKSCLAFPALQLKVLAECEKLDPTLSFFAMELSTVSRDIEFVENQENGLQVESANKKMLWKELSEVLSSVSVDEITLNNIMALPLTERNLQQVEGLLKPLYTALKAIRGDEEEEDSNLGVLRALKERRQAYEVVTGKFINRVADEIHKKFVSLQHEKVPNDQLANVLGRLLMFSSVILFAKDFSFEVYTNIIDEAVSETQILIEKKSAPLLQGLESLINSDKNYSATSGLYEQKELLSRWEENRISKELKSAKPKNSEVLQELVSALEVMESLALTYQNFVGIFFHLSDSLDFEEFVTAYPNSSSRISPLNVVDPIESDRESAGLKMQLMTKIFQSIFNDFFNILLDFTKKQASLIPVILLYLEEGVIRYEGSNQEFLMATFEKFFGKFTQEWQEYVTDQGAAIERATINPSLKGVTPFATGFTSFIVHVEDEISFISKSLEIDVAKYPKVRKTLDSSYNLLGQSLLALLQKDFQGPVSNSMMPTSHASKGGPHSITLLINCNWVIEVLPVFGSESLFVDCLQSTRNIFNVEKERYAETLLRSSMNHLYSFVDGAYPLMEASKSRVVSPSQWSVYSQHNLNKILERYSSHEIAAVVDKLYHIIQQEILNSSQTKVSAMLLEKLWSCIQGQTVSLYLKLYTLIEKQYKGTNVKFTKNEIISAFNSHKSAS
ncbi:LAME_0F08526g1_1 [Lachancea meyersii CBS 8951]|uniref:LAME_0F08526g1_1 n=1 Tax=Lachancea meyersii CBS 8951 TaxID=1266667 RepID=A0A1G4JUL9_9SACH|nr:LAME_0F08526g1_1 [Lachancea meyersii CBS 8951]